MRLLCTGRSAVWKWRQRNGQVGELWPVPSHWIKLKTADSGISHYEILQRHGRYMTVPRQDVMYCWFPDPASMFKPAAPLGAADQDVQTDNERATYLYEMLRNGKVPGLIVKTAEPLDTEQRDLLTAAIKDAIGRGNRGNELLLEGGIEAEMQIPLKDLDWPGVASLSESRICSAIGVPPILVGARVGLDRSTFSNYKEARQSFYQETMLPLWGFLGDTLTAGLPPDEREKDTVLIFDASEITALVGANAAKSERAIALFQGSLVDRNEARTMAGLDALAGEPGKVYLLPISMQEISIEEGPAQEPVAPEGEHLADTEVEEMPAHGEGDRATEI